VSWFHGPEIHQAERGYKPVLRTLRAPPLQESSRSTWAAGLALPSPEPVAELRLGCQAVAVAMRSHQLPDMQTSERQLAFRSADTYRSWTSFEQVLP